ncbi:MAG TPA: type ISP restriction/modification enzyme [Thiopseudomonas sp.]|nr:type ISP restriction/modification enzyme [Thiopseudomonas sp.]
MSALTQILASFREQAITERDKGTDFEHLSQIYLRNEPYYRDLYQSVLTYGEWAEQQGISKKDTGIDLVAITHTGETHAIQCKNYAPEYSIAKKDIDSFFTASGKTDFARRIIMVTTNNWTQNASDSLENQSPPVNKIDLSDLENSLIDWSQFQVTAKPVLKAQKSLREHQQTALSAVVKGLASAERGKLIMACGTGKTFTSLKIAESMAGKGKVVLFLVPSLSLLSQTLTEWTQESQTPLHNFAVCSDSEVGKKRNIEDDQIQATASDLQYPATTNAKSLGQAFAVRHDSEHMSVVYATYHSIAVLHDAQEQFGLPAFDLIVCDEAHRTTGATFEGDEESAFVRVHDNDYIQAHKRLYMTATPRIYGEQARSTEGVELYSMDDRQLYGDELYVINFSEAVSRGLLVDYKVIVLAVEEGHINRRLQSMLKDDNNELKVDDAAKIVGCWKALSKQGITQDEQEDTMRRAVAFCQVIEKEYKGKKHKVSSKLISEMFGAVVDEYQKAEVAQLQADDPDAIIEKSLLLKCEAEHVDGSMNASQKEARLNWLKEETPDNTCRILSNVRCLSEGVDVPSLDAVLFLTPRNSQVDVVQSVGRVMRLAPGKKQGYVILPVVIPAGVEPEQALDDNQTYRVVWQVLNALRSHDDRFDAMINKLEFNGRDVKKMEVVSVADKVQQRSKSTGSKAAKKARGGSAIGAADSQAGQQAEISFEVGEIERALYARVVKKCGNRHHWEDWANDIAKIANTHIDRIQAIIEDPEHTTEIAAFNAFAAELRDDLNNSISDAEIIEMLAQHLITKPVFDALFGQYSFAQNNPMSQAMQLVLDQLQEHHLEKERDTLESFYQSVKMRAEGIESAEGKQRIIVELYDKFFANAFPRMTQRLGIVYTPIEVVDFILHSVEHVLQTEFNSSMAEDNVHILDPFTGTGTFITRLLQSGIIPKDKLPHKYLKEIHANELVLLAYYIAAINIEATYHGILNNNVTGQEEDSDQIFEVPYKPFEGICLTDTFQMNEKADLIDEILEENSARRKRQQQLDIRVIIGNPPYSVGQESANDNNTNVVYSKLDKQIETTYAKASSATLQRNLYDSYVRAIRWSSDRIKDRGVIGFVTNASFVDGNSMDGLRKCLVKEFSNIYIFHLRGNQRTSGERSRKEGGKIFDSGSRAPIAISILVKNPKNTISGQIFFHDIGDYLNRNEKLEAIADLHSIKGISKRQGWQTIIPDEFGDWLNQRDPNFDSYISLGDKRNKQTPVVFENYSQGILTSRDAWCINYSKEKLMANIGSTIDFYNHERVRYHQALGKKNYEGSIESFINNDASKISWSRALRNNLAKDKHELFDIEKVRKTQYRPFSSSNLYFDKIFNEMTLQIPRIFPTKDSENLVFSVTGRGSTKEFSTLITNAIPDYEMVSKGQCFPLYLYDEVEADTGLFAQQGSVACHQRRDAITNVARDHFQEAYPKLSVSKEDVFYYIYGLLHSEDYRERYADNLSKQLPRIPRVSGESDFSSFVGAGRRLAKLHLNFETVPLYRNTMLTGKVNGLTVDTNKGVLGGKDEDFRVTKMKFLKKKDPETGKNIDDKTRVAYNAGITIEGIPEEAYDYVVNGKPALEWVMERQAVTTHKDSGITNDANDWAIETMGNAKYPLELFLRVITVSLETQTIVNSLPKLVIQGN